MEHAPPAVGAVAGSWAMPADVGGGVAEVLCAALSQRLQSLQDREMAPLDDSKVLSTLPVLSPKKAPREVAKMLASLRFMDRLEQAPQLGTALSQLDEGDVTGAVHTCMRLGHTCGGDAPVLLGDGTASREARLAAPRRG